MSRFLSSLSRRRFILAAVALAAVVGFGRPAAAAADATAFVESLGQKALSSLTTPDLDQAEREKRVRALLRTYFDVDTIGRFVLGPNWRTATEAQRAEYIKLFERMIVTTYAQRFSEYSGQDFKVGKSVKASDRDTVVSSQSIQQGGPPIAVDWRVRNKNGQLKIIDVLVEGISMSVTQRSDFTAVIQSGGGIEALLESLRKRAGAAK
jgi:phospholipid transport system substrate-binding protein